MFELVRSRGYLPLERSWQAWSAIYGTRLLFLLAIVFINLAALPLIYAVVWFVWKVGIFGIVVVLATLTTVVALGIGLDHLIRSGQRTAATLQITADELRVQQQQMAQYAEEMTNFSHFTDDIGAVSQGLRKVTEQLGRAGAKLSTLATEPTRRYEELAWLLSTIEADQAGHAGVIAQQNATLVEPIRELAERLASQEYRTTQALERLELAMRDAAHSYTKQAAALADLMDESHNLTAALAEVTARLVARAEADHAAEREIPPAQPAKAPARPQAQLVTDLAQLHRLRYEASGNVADLDASIVLTEQAMTMDQ